jgi:hypothetical protein
MSVYWPTFIPHQHKEITEMNSSNNVNPLIIEDYNTHLDYVDRSD